MESISNAVSVAPTLPPKISSGEQSGSISEQSASFWPSFLMATALTSMAIGIVWDISWHETIGRDTFWTPAHMAIYLGGALAGCVGGWLAIKHTFFASQPDRDASVSVFGARAPLGAWVAIWGSLAMITSAPFDNWWHNAYGLDVKIISPPHAVLGLGMLGSSVGALLLVLSRQNRLADTTSTSGSGLFIYTGGIFVLVGTIFILEYIFPNHQHGGMFYKVCAIMYPMRLVALSCAGRISWPATRVAAVYMAFMCAMNWVLVQFPAHPKLAPIFNPVTHMVPLPFPLLLIFPAIAIDLLLRNKGEVKSKLLRVGFAVLLGGAFLFVFFFVQYLFSSYMISPRANNWFFMGDRHFGYNVSVGAWHHQFWFQDPNKPEADLLKPSGILIAWAIASISSGLGLFFGRWMRKVRR